MAAHLTAAGVWVIGTYNRSVAEAYEFGEQVAKNGGRLAFLHLDVSRTELFQDFARSVAQVLNDWGVQQFDYLGNNAGIAYFTPYPETPEEQFDEPLVRRGPEGAILPDSAAPAAAEGRRAGS